MPKDKKRVYQQMTEEIKVVDTNSGEITEEVSKKTEMSYVEMEPQYIKVYLDCILKFKGISSSFNPILLSLCKHMQYADKNQIVFVNKYVKEIICSECGVKIKRVEQAIKQFVESGLLLRQARGVYLVNPYIISRGKWEDIKELRATFDFMTGDIEVESNVIDAQNEAAASTENA